MGGEWPKLDQGVAVGYRLTVVLPSDRRYGAEAKAETIEPLLELADQFAELGYEFVRLERIYGQ